MRFYDALTQVTGRLFLERRITYHRLRHEFDLDDETIEKVRHELVVGRRCARARSGSS